MLVTVIVVVINNAIPRASEYPEESHQRYAIIEEHSALPVFTPGPTTYLID